MNSQREFFNNVAHKWDTMCVHDHGKINRILDMVEIKEGSSILDVACGTGILAPFLHERNKKGRITCVDISDNMIKVAKSKYDFDNIEFFRVDIMYFKPVHKFDSIILYSCFPHFEDKEGLINNISSMLNRGGKICICHSQSRDAINNLHKSREEVSEDNLPKACITSGMMKGAGLEVLECIDDDEMYAVLGVNEKSVL